jgi:hypothetical protein
MLISEGITIVGTAAIGASDSQAARRKRATRLGFQRFIREY